MMIQHFLQKHLKLVVILTAIAIAILLLFTLPLAKVKTDTPNSLYINGKRISSNESRTSIGLKTIMIATPELQPNSKRVFLLPFQTYQLQAQNKHTPDSILKQANFSAKSNAKILSSKMLNNDWFIVKSGIDAPDAQVTLVILSFNQNVGRWSIEYQGAGYDETLQGSVPDYVYEYINSGGI